MYGASCPRFQWPVDQARRRARFNNFVALVNTLLQTMIARGVFAAFQIFAAPAHQCGFPCQPMAFEGEIHHFGLIRPGAARQLCLMLERISRCSQFDDGRYHFSS